MDATGSVGAVAPSAATGSPRCFSGTEPGFDAVLRATLGLGATAGPADDGAPAGTVANVAPLTGGSGLSQAAVDRPPPASPAGAVVSPVAPGMAGAGGPGEAVAAAEAALPMAAPADSAPEGAPEGPEAASERQADEPAVATVEPASSPAAPPSATTPDPVALPFGSGASPSPAPGRVPNPAPAGVPGAADPMGRRRERDEASPAADDHRDKAARTTHPTDHVAPGPDAAVTLPRGAPAPDDAAHMAEASPTVTPLEPAGSPAGAPAAGPGVAQGAVIGVGPMVAPMSPRRTTAAEVPQDPRDPSPVASAHPFVTVVAAPMTPDAPSPPTLRPAARVALAQQVAPVAIALSLDPDAGGRIALRLDPAELGRVEVVVERVRESTAVHVAAERPETLALLARDGAQLDRALREAGIGGEGGRSLSFSLLSDGGAGGHSGDPRGGGTGRAWRDAPPPRADATRMRDITTLLDIAI